MRDLTQLLEAINTEAPLAQRHLWLIELFDWVRGDASSTIAAINRLQLLLDVVQARPELQTRLRQWWHQLLHILDAASLLADFGFAQRSAFVSELTERIRLKLLPATPETTRTVVTPLAAGPQAVVTPGQGAEAPTPESIALLKSNPGLVAQFEQRFGPGTAAQYLGGR